MPSYRNLMDESPDPPRFSTTSSNNRFAGETPFRAAVPACSSGNLFSPIAGTQSSEGGLFGRYGTDEDAPGEEEEDVDAEYEVDDNPVAQRKPPGKAAAAGGKYSSPTDGDDEESPYAHADDDEEEEEEEEEEEGEGEGQSDEADDEDGDSGEYYDDEDATGDSYEQSSANGDTVQEESPDREATPRQKRPAYHRRGKRSVSIGTFLAHNPPSLIVQSNTLLSSLVKLLSPSDQEEDNIFAIGSFSRLGSAPSSSKKASYIAKHVSLFLTHLQHVSKTSAEPAIGKAYYLAWLLLSLHHPSVTSTPAALAKGTASPPSPIETYKAFLKTHHPNPSIEDLETLHAYHPTPCASPAFWDVVAHLTLRGELMEAESLLSRGGWENIMQDAPMGNSSSNEFKYTDDEVTVIERLVSGGAKLVAAAPQLFAKGKAEHERVAEWRIYRGRVHAAIEELKMLSHNAPSNTQDDEAEEGDVDYRYEMVLSTKNGFTTQTRQFTKVPRNKGKKGVVRGDDRPITRVPSDVEMGLMSVYLILVGKIDGILTLADRWEEAVLGVAIWRRYLDPEELEEEEEEGGDGMGFEGMVGDMGRQSSFFGRNIRTSAMFRSAIGGAQKTAAKDADKKSRRLRRTYDELETLKHAYTRVTRRDLPLNTTNMLEVGVGHVLQGDWKKVLDILVSADEGMVAYCVVEFVAEVAKMGEWRTEGCEDWVVGAGTDLGMSLLRGFRDEDVTGSRGGAEAGLVVAASGSDAERERIKRVRRWEEKLVEAYVRCLVKAGTVKEAEGDEMEVDNGNEARAEKVEGWEVAMQLLQRWGVITAGEATEWGRKIAVEILSSLPLTSTQQVEKLLHHAKSNSLPETYVSISASYARRLYSDSQLGPALLYFSRAGNRQKIHAILTRLLAQSLMLSTAYPPWDKLDPTFRSLLSHPGAGIATDESLGFGGEEEILRFELSGYAAVRGFYEARDHGDKSRAARALVALIRSAGEMVDGGQGVDGGWPSAVEWWVAGVLIGEVLVFLGGEKRVLAVREMFDVLKVIQDFVASIAVSYPAQPASSQQQQHSATNRRTAKLNKAEIFLRKTLFAYRSPHEIPKLLAQKMSKGSFSQLGGGGTDSFGMGSSWQHLEHPGDEDMLGSESERDEDEDEEDEDDEEGGEVLAGDMSPEGFAGIKRGWDWRASLVRVLDREEHGLRRRGGRKGGVASSSGVLETVVRIARVGFARELARGWLDGEGSWGWRRRWLGVGVLGTRRRGQGSQEG
ncbi:hypothetical protein BDZ91DRAFT_798449 [Kalaharituber pfeilii]|nr:hypothetical protein BDZ91DRAFT_798449 [Kalaharituber pfeilii]